MSPAGDFNFQKGKNISYRKDGGDGWLKMLIIGIVGTTIAAGVIFYLGWS
jgi:hypothetical protein